MKNHSRQHDAAMATMRAVLKTIKDDLPYERRLSVMYLLYRSFRAGLESYEALAATGDTGCGPGTEGASLPQDGASKTSHE